MLNLPTVREYIRHNCTVEDGQSVGLTTLYKDYRLFAIAKDKYAVDIDDFGILVPFAVPQCLKVKCGLGFRFKGLCIRGEEREVVPQLTRAEKEKEILKCLDLEEGVILHKSFRFVGRSKFDPIASALATAAKHNAWIDSVVLKEKQAAWLRGCAVAQKAARDAAAAESPAGSAERDALRLKRQRAEASKRAAATKLRRERALRQRLAISAEEFARIKRAKQLTMVYIGRGKNRSFDLVATYALMAPRVEAHMNARVLESAALRHERGLPAQTRQEILADLAAKDEADTKKRNETSSRKQLVDKELAARLGIDEADVRRRRREKTIALVYIKRRIIQVDAINWEATVAKCASLLAAKEEVRAAADGMPVVLVKSAGDINIAASVAATLAKNQGKVKRNLEKVFAKDRAEDVLALRLGLSAEKFEYRKRRGWIRFVRDEAGQIDWPRTVAECRRVKRENKTANIDAVLRRCYDIDDKALEARRKAGLIHIVRKNGEVDWPMTIAKSNAAFAEYFAGTDRAFLDMMNAELCWRENAIRDGVMHPEAGPWVGTRKNTNDDYLIMIAYARKATRIHEKRKAAMKRFGADENYGLTFGEPAVWRLVAGKTAMRWRLSRAAANRRDTTTRSDHMCEYIKICLQGLPLAEIRRKLKYGPDGDFDPDRPRVKSSFSPWTRSYFDDLGDEEYVEDPYGGPDGMSTPAPPTPIPGYDRMTVANPYYTKMFGTDTGYALPVPEGVKLEADDFVDTPDDVADDVDREIISEEEMIARYAGKDEMEDEEEADEDDVILGKLLKKEPIFDKKK